MSDTINRIIAQKSEAWASQYLQQRAAYLSGKQHTASGQLTQSMAHEVTGGSDGPVRVELAFAEHGRFIDMKKPGVTAWGRDAIERLTGWVEKKGVSRFLPGYMRKNKRKAEPKNAAERIAWGIMQARKNGRMKRVKWYAKSSAGAVNDLFNEVAAAIPDQVISDLKQSFKQP